MNNEEVNCPECGAKCKVTKKPQYPNCNFVDYFALPQPDLTKLRKTFKTLIEICTALPMDELKYAQITDEIIRNVQEILE